MFIIIFQDKFTTFTLSYLVVVTYGSNVTTPVRFSRLLELSEPTLTRGSLYILRTYTSRAVCSNSAGQSLAICDPTYGST